MIRCIFVRFNETSISSASFQFENFNSASDLSNQNLTTSVNADFIVAKNPSLSIHPQSDVFADESAASDLSLSPGKLHIKPPLPTSNAPVPMESVRPFGLPGAKELVRFLISLIDAHDHHNTDTMRIIGLSVLLTVLEVGAPSILKHSELLFLLGHDGCKNLFQVFGVFI